MMSAPVLLLAFLIGMISGLRALTAPALVAWAARLNWLALANTPLAFMGTTVAAVIFSAFAVLELIGDKRASTPSRTAWPGLIARIVFGGVSGAALAAAHSLALGAAAGAIGGIAGAFAGYEVRTRVVKALGVPDFVIALLEDGVAIGGGCLIIWWLGRVA